MAREFATFKFASFYANLKANLIGDFKEIYSEKLWLKPPSKIPIDGALYDELDTVNDMSVLTFIPECLDAVEKVRPTIFWFSGGGGTSHDCTEGVPN